MPPIQEAKFDPRELYRKKEDTLLQAEPANVAGGAFRRFTVASMTMKPGTKTLKMGVRDSFNSRTIDFSRTVNESAFRQHMEEP